MDSWVEGRGGWMVEGRVGGWVEGWKEGGGERIITERFVQGSKKPGGEPASLGVRGHLHSGGDCSSAKVSRSAAVVNWSLCTPLVAGVLQEKRKKGEIRVQAHGEELCDGSGGRSGVPRAQGLGEAGSFSPAPRAPGSGSLPATLIPGV